MYVTETWGKHCNVNFNSKVCVLELLEDAACGSSSERAQCKTESQREKGRSPQVGSGNSVQFVKKNKIKIKQKRKEKTKYMV